MILLALVLVVGCATSPPGAATGHDADSVNCGHGRLPIGVLQSLRTQFAGWRIKTFDDLEPYHRQLWTETRGNECPGIAVGRFLMDSVDVVCLLLVRDQPGKRGYKIVAFSPRRDKSRPRVLVVEDEPSGNAAGVVLCRVAPGILSGVETTQPVRLVLDGLQVEELEVGSTLYYWKDGRFRHIRISE